MKQAAYGAELFNYLVKEVPNPHGETTHCRWFKGGNQSETLKIIPISNWLLERSGLHIFL